MFKNKCLTITSLQDFFVPRTVIRSIINTPTIRAWERLILWEEGLAFQATLAYTVALYTGQIRDEFN